MSAAPAPDRDAELLAAALGAVFLGRSSRRGKLANGVTSHAALETRDLMAHALGSDRKGAVPFVDDERVGWACIDLDARLYALDPDEPEARAMFDGIVTALALRGLRGFVERSKSKGWHVWLIFDEPAPARDVRTLLRRIALDAGARDEADLVCPRQDRVDAIGNGTWLPVFGGDVEPATRFYTFDADDEEWLQAADQLAVLREMAEHPSPSRAIPPAPSVLPVETSATADGDEHPCAWIVDELRDLGIELDALKYGRDKIEFRCPIHASANTRPSGGSAVMWSDGHGHCSSTKCDRKWRTVAELVALLGCSTAPVARPVVYTLANVERRELEWLWPGRIPLGKITIYDGDPGLGKSLSTADLGARISRGLPMPDGATTIASDVVMLSAEDDLADTIRPRLEMAGADLKRVHVLHSMKRGDAEAWLPALPDDLPVIESVIAKHTAKLVIIDPLMAYLSSDVNAHRDQDVRRTLAPLAKMAERTRAAVLVVRHLNKGGSGSNPLYRGGGSIGIIGAARSGLLVARDPEDPERRVLAVTKSNLSAPAPSLGFRVVAKPEGVMVEWLGAVERDANDLLAEMTAEDRSSLEDAAGFLREVLSRGAVTAAEVKKQAKSAGIADRTLARAKAALRVRSLKAGLRGGWSWALPEKLAKAEERHEDCQSPTNGTLGTLRNSLAAFEDGWQPSKNDEGCQGCQGVEAASFGLGERS